MESDTFETVTYAEALGLWWSLRSMTLDQKLARVIAAYLVPLLLLGSVVSVALATKRTFFRGQATS